jgi:hypothetical protein
MDALCRSVLRRLTDDVHAAARLVVGTEIERGDGLEALERALDDPSALAPAGLVVELDGPVARMECGGASALVALPRALEVLGAAVAEHGWGVVDCRGVRALKFVPGLAAWAHARRLPLSVASPAEEIVVLFAGAPGTAPPPADPWGCGRGYAWLAGDRRSSERELAAMHHGVEVDPERWTRLATFAHAGLVEPSERSRLDAGPP